MQHTPTIETREEAAAWESILASVGIALAEEVNRVVYDLKHGYDADFGIRLRPPFRASDLQPYTDRARASLDARRAFDHRTRSLRHKDTA